VLAREDRSHVLENLDKLVVKAANESGGYGMLIGPHATPRSARDFRAILGESPQLHRPAHAGLSRVPRDRASTSKAATSTCGPTSSTAEDIYVLPGGLTRVALRKGSLVVNSSQGGGSKDTWVLGSTSST
jgi:uncharacterized circularly permuted ATP-grasp superfamily protein